MSDIELKTCPFCGGEPMFRDDGGSSSGYVVRCKGCSATAYGRKPDEARWLWNNRPQEVCIWQEAVKDES